MYRVLRTPPGSGKSLLAVSAAVLISKLNTFVTKTKNNKIDSEILLARNDPYMNQHSRFIAHAWRANVDQSVIINYSDAVNYMVKYATKSKILFYYSTIISSKSEIKMYQATFNFKIILLIG